MAKGRIKKKIKEKIKEVKDKASNAVAKAKYSVLLPFKGVMVKALKQKGFPVSNATKIEKLAPMFADIIIRKKTKIDFLEYEHLDVPPEVAEAAAPAIIDLILSFIQGLKNKKDRGEKLTPDEENILNGAEKVADAAKDAAASGAKNWFADLWFVWVAVIALLLFFAFKKK